MEEGGKSCFSHCLIIFLFSFATSPPPFLFCFSVVSLFCPWFKLNFPLLFDIAMYDHGE